jgi:trimeric autotransporter adhesin
MMRRHLLPFLTLFLVVISFALGSCAEHQVPALDVTPSSTTLVSEQKVQLVVDRRFAGGPVEHVTDRVTYASSNKSVATVSSSGLVTAGVDPGSAVIRIEDPTSDATAVVTVTVAARGEAAQLSAIVVSPNPSTISVGQTAQLFAQGVYADGTTKPITSGLSWTSTNTAAVTIDSSGLARALAVGDATITAASADGVIKGSAAVHVP